MKLNNLMILIAILVVATLSTPAMAQISIGGAIFSETEKHPIAMNLVMAVHIVQAPDWAYRPSDADRLLAAPLAAVASSAMGGPAGKPANVPAYFRVTPQGVKNLVSLELSFNGVDFVSTENMGEDGYIGVVPRLRPGLYTPVARLTHKDGRKDVTILFFIRSGKSVEGNVTAAFQLFVTNPIAGIERMSTREIAALCMNTIPADGLGTAAQVVEAVSAAPIQALPAPTAGEQSIDFAPPVVETPRQEVAREEGTLVVRFAGREPANGWPEIKVLGPDGEHYFRVPQGQTEMRVRVPVGEYRLAGISQYGWVLDGSFSQRLGAGGNIEFTVRPKEGR